MENNTVKNLYLALAFATLFAVPCFSHAQTSQAETADGFTLNFGEQAFTLSQREVNSARGSFKVSSQSNLAKPAMLKDSALKTFLGIKKIEGQTHNFSHNPSGVYQLVKNASNAISKDPVNPTLKIENGRAVSFTPPQEGLNVDTLSATLSALEALKKGEKQMQLPVSTTSPDTLLSETNNLGIKELIARGTSNFKGSPKNRRHNIKIGVEKVSGIILAPGEEFSFNKFLGPVEEDAGFLPELVIKRSGTVPELGGGLCQVSSTTFRAAMQAGLPITQRKNHSYAVQYYAPQGTDATIYPGVIDLKFKNDTPGHILIWPHFTGPDDLVFDFYGTKDNRVVELKKPYQYDKKIDGSMKAEWTRVITKNGETSTTTFKSVYLPPALFHKEEQFISPTSTPAQSPVTMAN